VVLFTKLQLIYVPEIKRLHIKILCCWFTCRKSFPNFSTTR